MSTEDIEMVSKVLMGITNPEKEIRTAAMSKLEELRKNLGAITYCLLQIAQLPSNTQQEELIKTTALVICRKILDSNEIEPWKNIDNNLKNQIKIKSLELFINENQENQKNKICDVITQIIDKISDCEEDWEDLKKLSLNILNLNPSDEKNTIQIISFLKLLTDGTSFLYDNLKENFNKLIPYLRAIFQTHFLKMKVSASNFISELIAYCDKEDLKEFKPLLINILQSILEAFTNNKEEYLKDLLQTLIEMCSVEPKLFKPLFQDLFPLCKQIIEKKDFDDEKIRELAFEVILNLIEEQPEIMKKRKEDLKILFDMIYKYSLEMNKEIESSWYNPKGNNYEEIEIIEEENVQFSQGLVERLVESLGLNETQSLLTELINNLINQNDWVFKYIGLFSFSSLSSYDEIDLSTIEIAFPVIFDLTKFEHPKVKFAAIHCINKLCDNFNPHFQKKYINQIFPLIFEIFPKENILRIQCEIIETLCSFIEFTSSNTLMPYVPQLLDLLFNLFLKDIPIILRKSVIECILEVFSTIEKESQPYAKKSFDLILTYFIEIYKTKSNKILYGGLIECLTTIGPYTKEDFYKIIPDIVKCIIELVQGINFDNDPIRADLQNSIERLVPILLNDFKDLLPNLISVVLALLKIKPKISVSSTPNKEIDVSEFLNDNEDEKKKKKLDIHSSETEDFAENLSLLNKIIETLEGEFLPYVNEVEKEVIPLLIDGSTNKIRNKCSKILPNLISILKDNNQKKEKGILYIQSLISAIEKETDYHTCEKLFIHLGEVIDNSGEILTKSELNELFAKIMKYFQNLEKKRINLVSKKENKKTKKNKNEDDSLEGDLSDLLDEDIEKIQNIQSEISDVIGILFKTHKNLSGDIIEIILKEFLPKFVNSKSNFEQKMALYITDDLIEYLGQKILFNVWDDLYNLITNLCKKKDDEIRQAAAYGIGIFTKFTDDNFNKYAEGLINALKEGLKITPDDENDEESFGLAYDNLIASIGKIIYYRFNNDIIQKYSNELIDIWITNLPIKYDSTEQEQQHEWFCDMILFKNELIQEKYYNIIFKNLASIYNSKGSNENINNKIIQIFEHVKNNEKLKNVVHDIYNCAELKIKTKLESLIKQ